MTSAVTLLFLCDQPHLYPEFLRQFRAAEFQMPVARNLAQAKAVLLSRSVKGIVLLHDSSRDDRPLAAQLKRMSPHTPIFLLTDQEQPRPADIDAVWRAALDDETVARGMAVFFCQLFRTRPSPPQPRPLLVGLDALFPGIRANRAE
jgi:hypothetical protein